MNIIIVGAGEVGRHIAESLSNRQHDICVIEMAEDLAESLNDNLNVSIICDNGASVAVLAEANVGECDLFLALTSDDNTNLISASMAKTLGAKKTIARVRGGIQREEWLFNYRQHFGIDYLLGSERLAAVELAKFVRTPEGLMVEELARGRIEMQQLVVASGSHMIEKPLASLDLPSRMRIALIQRGDQVIIPGATDMLKVNDIVTLFGQPRGLTDLISALNPEHTPEKVSNVVIFGGDEYGFALAQMLEGGPCRVRIIEQDPKLCRTLSNLLQKTIVIQGNATSLTLLKEERVGEADFFVATTSNDEDNVMTCLQAKNLGTRYCLTLIHRADYADIVSQNREKLGILGAISPRMATSRDLLRFVTAERFHVIMNLAANVELIEAVISKNSNLAEKKVAEIRWPEESGLVALLQGQNAMVPTANDTLHVGDTIYGLVSSKSRRRFLKLLAD